MCVWVWGGVGELHYAWDFSCLNPQFYEEIKAKQQEKYSQPMKGFISIGHLVYFSQIRSR